MSKTTTKEARQKAADDRYLANVAALANDGHLEPEVWPGGCGRCGGDLTITPYVTPRPGPMVSVPMTDTINTCDVCRVDRVQRWGDIMQASAAEGRELRNGNPTARVLQKAGLVRYNRTDKAWELTRDGSDLLARYDNARVST